MFVRALLLMWCVSLSAQLFAQPYPTKPIRVVVTYPPGGSTDVVARLLGFKLTDLLGQQVVIDNRGGAGGIIGTDIVAHAAPDGYTLLFGTSAGLSINPLLHKKLPYDVQRDFAPVSLVVVNPQVLVAYPGLPANTVSELIKLARARPGQINYASPGVGSPNHMGMELLKSMTHIDLVHVPYKGGGPAMTDLLSGQVSLLFNSIPSVLPQMKTGKLKALAVGSAQRSPAIPDVPTVSESGVPGFEYATWYGVFAPASTPNAIISRVNQAIVSALKNPELAQQLAVQGSEPKPTTSEALARFVRDEHERWARVVKATGIKVQ
jgi:tripartite-type tricarboxylate transporter receptor subunit TctC